MQCAHVIHCTSLHQNSVKCISRYCNALKCTAGVALFALRLAVIHLIPCIALHLTVFQCTAVHQKKILFTQQRIHSMYTALMVQYHVLPVLKRAHSYMSARGLPDFQTCPGKMRQPKASHIATRLTFRHIGLKPKATKRPDILPSDELSRHIKSFHSFQY